MSLGNMLLKKDCQDHQEDPNICIKQFKAQLVSQVLYSLAGSCGRFGWISGSDRA